MIPKWDKISSIILSNYFEKGFGYILGVFGLIVGLRIKLIGEGDNLVGLINGNYLILACITFAVSGVLWKITEATTLTFIPDDIREYTSVFKYLDQIKKGIYNQSYFEESYEERMKGWNDTNISLPEKRFFILLILTISLSLYLLSLIFLLLSSRDFLFHSYHLIVAPGH